MDIKYRMKPSGKGIFGLLSACALLVAAGTAHAAVLIDFETGTELSGQFRLGNAPTAYSQSANGAGNDVLNYVQGTGASTLFYDANGATAGSSVFAVSIGNPLTVSATVTMATANGSFGFFFGNPFNEVNGNLLALLNINQSGETDQFRFDNNFSSSTAGVGSLGGGTTGDAGITLNSAFTISATYTILAADSYRISMTAGSITSSRDYTGTPLTSVQVGLRTNANSAATASMVDDINVSGDPTTVIVPEVSTALLGLGGTLGLLVRRRRAA